MDRSYYDLGLVMTYESLEKSDFKLSGLCRTRTMLELFAKASILLLECILQQSLNGKKKERMNYDPGFGPAE